MPHADCQTAPTPVETFADRAIELVAFVAQACRRDQATPGAPEQQLAEWIWQRQQVSTASGHLAGVELGIILRALNGPHSGPLLVGIGDQQQLCSLIAKSLSQGPD